MAVRVACACATATSTSETGDVRVSSENEVHESAGIGLDHIEELGLRGGELLHKLIVEVRVLQDALANQTKVRVRSKRSEWVGTAWHSSAHA